MKFLIVLATIAAVTVAVPVQRGLVPVAAGPTFVVDENGTPIVIGPAVLETSPVSVGPAVIDLSPISVGPAIVDLNPISIGPAILDFPLPDGGDVNVIGAPAVNPSPVVQPSPVVIGEIPSGASPLVQIIVNVIGQESAVAPAPVDSAVVDEVYVPGPVNVVDNFFPETVVDPIQVVNPVVVEPIQVVSPVVNPGPVNVVETAPVAPEPVQVVNPVVVPGPVNIVDNVVVEPIIVGTPIIPAPVVIPDILN